jgi:hypothetical protein
METIEPGAKIWVLANPHEVQSRHIIPGELLSWPDRRGPAHGIALCGYRYTSETEGWPHALFEKRALNETALIDAVGSYETTVADDVACSACVLAYTKLFNRNPPPDLARLKFKLDLGVLPPNLNELP